MSKWYHCQTFLKIKNRLYNPDVAFHRPISVLQPNNNQEKYSIHKNISMNRSLVNNAFRKHNEYSSIFCVLACGIGVAITFCLYKNQESVYALKQIKNSDLPIRHKLLRKDLPTYSMAEVGKHASNKTGIWVTYGIGVYDITKFVPKHPGSDKILVGAGSSIDPFWNIYQQHNTAEILNLLETFRIGNLAQEDEVDTNDLLDPWSNEPKRHATLKPTSTKPFNAEPPPSLLVEKFITPNEYFYVRNHLPVPDIAAESYELEIEIEGTKITKTFKLADLMALPKHHVTAAIMCGGNRRSEMTTVKSVKGLSWGPAAVGNAVWSGPKLCDILENMGVKSNDVCHVHFEGFDMDPMSTYYAASIPLSKAMDPRGDVILAYEMNGQPLSRDHGFPLRAICPGIVGARNVKWLGKITVSPLESDSHWQQNDYKGFSPSTDWHNVDFSKSPAIQNMPVTSAICSPSPDQKVLIKENGCITVQGYAWSGGGNKIVRVDLTADGGKTWHVAELTHGINEDESNLCGRNWAWSLFKADIPIPEGATNVEIWSKAVDSNYNVQPESFENIWNLRGVLSNAYSRVRLMVINTK